MPLVTTTENRDFKLLGARGDYALEARERLRELGTDYVALLAEPVSETGWGRTAWFTEGSVAAKPLNSLGDAEAGELLERLRMMRLEIGKLASRIAAPTRGVPGDGELAQALQRLAVVPDDEHFVWSVDGKPLLVGWGMIYLNDLRSEQTVIGEGLLPRSAWPVGGETPTQVLAAPFPVVRRRFWPLLTWLLFIGLLCAIDFLLLRACGIFVAPENGLLRWILPTACHATAGGINPALLDERAELEDKVRKAELDLARLQGECTPAQVPQREARGDPPPPPGPRQPGPSLDQRLDREKAKTGQLQISLAWNGNEDLDLHVKCPGGELSFNSPGKQFCGGTLDVDMNSERSSVDAVENSFWPNPPSGNYEVIAVMWSRKGSPGRTVPFTVRVRREGQPDQNFNMSVTNEKENVAVFSFTIP
jgi:hypothetical protein